MPTNHLPTFDCRRALIRAGGCALLAALLISARGAEPGAPGEARLGDEASPRAVETVGKERVINVFFGQGATEVSAQGLALIRDIAESLKANIHLNVLLVGHTANLGSAEYCVAVAKKMTAAVAAELSKLNPRPGRIQELPLGNQEVADYLCVSEACRHPAATGRVEIRVSQ